MCCQYYFAEITGEAVKEAADSVAADVSFRNGLIRPSDRSTIITGRWTPSARRKTPAARTAFPAGTVSPCRQRKASDKPLLAEDMRWGFRSAVNPGQLIINARAETAAQKRTFSESLARRRCVIAADRFYEWDREKTKVEFTVPGREVIWLAGIWNIFDDGERYTVLTTEANASMRPVHDRMPLILREDCIADWIHDDDAAAEMLRQAGPELHIFREYEQLSLF